MSEVSRRRSVPMASTGFDGHETTSAGRRSRQPGNGDFGRRPVSNAGHGLDSYLARIGGLDVPTVAQERLLARSARLGREAQARLDAEEGWTGNRARVETGRRAHAELLSRNLKLVVAVAKRYPTSSRVELCDLIQEGNLALDHAIGKFDERRGFKLSTYAVKWIRQAMSRTLDRHSGLAKMPIETARQVRAALRDGDVDVDFLSPELHVASRAWLGASLDAPVGEDPEATPLVELLPAEVNASLEDTLVNRMWQEEFVKSLLDCLEPKTRHALVRRFGVDGERPSSIASVARELGVGFKRARSLIEAVLEAGVTSSASVANRPDSSFESESTSQIKRVEAWPADDGAAQAPLFNDLGDGCRGAVGVEKSPCFRGDVRRPGTGLPSMRAPTPRYADYASPARPSPPEPAVERHVSVASPVGQPSGHNDALNERPSPPEPVADDRATSKRTGRGRGRLSRSCHRSQL
jgi:RNA polymerase sigma factor (sigma-70 family)